MLAQTADDVAAALEQLGTRVASSGSSTAHASRHIASDDDVRIFTRNLADITDRVPEIVDAIRALDVSALVLDGEAIALRDDGRPEPFQVTMSRFGTKVVASTRTTPLVGALLRLPPSSTATT